MTTRTLTIMIADLVGSTQTATSVDVVRGAAFLEDATAPIRTIIQANEGTVIKFTGDGFIATFESARAALTCADDIRDQYIRQQHTPGGHVIDGVRVVVHTSDVVFENEDLVGDAIIVCARLEKSVPTNQVWCTAATREVVGISDFVFQPVGDLQVRGRAQPISVFSLENVELSYIEHGTVLMVTDLHQYRAASEQLSPVALNQWLSRWVNLHRQAVRGLRGHIRQFVADRVLVTFLTADEALEAAMKLQELIVAHNADRDDKPIYGFKAAIATGDIVLTANGIGGKLVNDTFDLLSATPRETVCLDTQTFEHLERHQEQTEAMDLFSEKTASPACYRLKT
jgi:class 3 adenylate cyclase